MTQDRNFTEFDYEGISPHKEQPGELKLGPNGARFIFSHKKRRRSYDVAFDVKWSEVISFDAPEVIVCKDVKSWPLNEDLPDNYKPLGQAGMVFLFMRRPDGMFFQYWAFIPLEDTSRVRTLIQDYLERPSLPGLAHHGTTAAVRYVLDHCTIIERHAAIWHEWLRRGPVYQPNKKRREKGPDYVFCKEGMAIDFFGANSELEQMSTFWPWRVMEGISKEDREILYRWSDGDYIYRQLVWDEERRNRILTGAKEVFELYGTLEHVGIYPVIRPWSFPSSFPDTWEKLEAFSSKPSRIGFPPTHGLDESTS
ncbi:MAG: hypothetical protein ACFFE2_06825 [Candidatus Thorarchaeota archaeon]